MTRHSPKRYGNISPETFCDVVDKQRADVAAISEKVLQDYEEERHKDTAEIVALRRNLKGMANNA